MRIHYWPSEHWIDDETHETIAAVADAAERDVRRRLPTLEEQLYLLVNQTSHVMPETGGGGFTIGPHCIRWDVDPGRVAEVARTSLRATLFHECHHAVRLQRRPEDEALLSWPAIAVFEGLASVFEDEAGVEAGARPSWRRYEPAVIADWADELLTRPIGADWADWKFHHPDGRRAIAYKVGAWLVDEAVARSGRSTVDPVWTEPEAVLELAGWSAPQRPT